MKGKLCYVDGCNKFYEIATPAMLKARGRLKELS